MNMLLAQQNEWEDPVRYEWNKEKPHTDFMLYESERHVVADDYEASPWYQSLNGIWKFIYVSAIPHSEKNLCN